MTIRDCAFSRTPGRIYDDVGEGESGIDAMTLFVNTERLMTSSHGTRRAWELVKIVCFTQPDIDGKFFSEVDYPMLYGIAANIQHAFAELDKGVAVAREAIKDRQNRAAESGNPY